MKTYSLFFNTIFAEKRKDMKTQTFYHDLATFRYNEEKGIIKLDGRFISFNPEGFWELIISHSDRIASNAEKLRIDFNIEYISSLDLKYLFMMLKSVLNTKMPYTQLVVNWNYEPFDSDHLELGRLIGESMPDTTMFQFKENWGNAVA